MNRAKYNFGLAFIGVVCFSIGAWLALKGEPEPARVDDPTVRVDPSKASREQVVDNRIFTSTDDRKLTRRKSADGEQAEKTEVAQPEGEDAKNEQTRKETWEDPTNQRVLGSKSWMAQPTEKENDAIAEKFAEDRKRRASDPPVDRVSRQNSIEAVRFEVKDCVDAALRQNPKAKTDVVLSWDALPSGEIRDINIVSLPGNPSPQFTDCLRSINGTKFDSSLPAVLFVEYPFMLAERSQ